MLARGRIEPIPEHIDEDRYLMRLGKALGVPAHEVSSLPLHWIGAARVDLEVERLLYERQRKKSEARRRGGRQRTSG